LTPLKEHLTFMTSGSIAAMNLFRFHKRWKYFGESPAIFSLKPSRYPVFPETPHPDPSSPQKKQTKAMTTSILKTKKMKGGPA
jgi:hypothetical protein